jgi:cytochrome P450
VTAIDYNPFNYEVQHNPYPTYRRLRDEAPVWFSEEYQFYAISRYADVLAAHLDPLTYLSSHGVTLEGGEAGGPFLIMKDPPEHEWHRRMVSRVFTPRRIAGLEDYVRVAASELLDPHLGGSGFDVVEDFSIQLPLRVISELLGIPAEHRQEVHHLADKLVARDENGKVSPESQHAGAELAILLASVVIERRKNPGDDVISLMLGADITDDEGNTRRMGDEELSYRVLELAFAGHETVARLIANGVVALAWYPDQRDALANDFSLMPNAVEEMLRWDPPSHYQGRWTSREVQLHDTVIPADRRVILVTGAATHDDRQYDDAELFDIGRRIDRPVTFGFGVHLCLGAALARVETTVAFEELLRRFPHYALADTGIVRMRSGNVRGLCTYRSSCEVTASRAHGQDACLNRDDASRSTTVPPTDAGRREDARC